MSVTPGKPNALKVLFGVEKPILGVVHLLPLPGSPRYDGENVDTIYEAAVDDASALAENGIDGIMVENAGDLPFVPPDQIGFETVAALATAIMRVRQTVDLPLGVLVAANGVNPALAIAKATGALWVRANQWVNAYVANEGLLNGPAGSAMRYRSALRGNEIRVFADVHVKFGAHAITADRSVQEQARDAEFFGADVLIASGERTGSPTESAEVLAVRSGTTLPVLVGSGFNIENAADLLRVADGAIVGSWLKHEGAWWNPVDGERVQALMAAVHTIREKDSGTPDV